jgi:hypothetical protein
MHYWGILGARNTCCNTRTFVWFSRVGHYMDTSDLGYTGHELPDYTRKYTPEKCLKYGNKLFPARS